VSPRAGEVPRTVVVDSSIAVKWFKRADESAVAEALDLLEQHHSGEVVLVVPGHFVAEVLNGLQYGGFELTEVQTAAGLIDEAGLIVVPLASQLTQPAVELAQAHRITIHDALFPALAMLLDCELVTADRAQARVTECQVRLLG